MPTTSKSFIDSNILIYAVDKADPVRRARARATIKRLVKSGMGAVSTQVAQEFFVIATKKLGVEPLAAKRVIDLLGQMEVVQVNLELILLAIDCSILSQISFWDALIVVSARAAGCKVILSDDWNDGQILNGVRIQNPLKN